MSTFKSAIPVLPVSDISRLAEFYSRTMSFAIAYTNEGYAVLARDDIQIHLWLAGDETWRTRSTGTPLESGAESFLAGTASCRVLVDGLEALYEEFKAKGIVHPNGHLADKPYGLTEFSILDADNNLVTFFRPTAEAGR